MAKNWCKIIRYEDHDVLFQLLSDDENGDHISITMVFDGRTATFNLGYEDEDKASKKFDNVSESDAKNYVGIMKRNLGLN